MFDGDDAKITVGAGRQFGAWGLDVMGGYALPSERHVAAQTALVLPGAYSMAGAVFIAELTYRQ